MRAEDYLAAVDDARAEYEAAAGVVVNKREAFYRAIAEAVAHGVPRAEAARVARVSRARVSQLVPVSDTVPARIHAQKKAPTRSCVAILDTVPHMPAPEVDTASGVASTRKRTRYGRTTGWWDTREDGTDLAEILAGTLTEGSRVGRVMLTGPAPEAAGATRAEAVRAWAMGDVDGWTCTRRYLAYADLPLLRFRHDETGHTVVVMRAAAWWGETDADRDTCRAAWAGLESSIGEAFPGMEGLADTPATTGKALWLRTIPEGKAFPVLSDTWRAFIRATSGQGRIEVCAGAGQGEDFTVLDGRLMYAALTSNMPVGRPVLWTAEAFYAQDHEGQRKTMRGRGRWRITTRVPEDWRHVGLLPARAEGGTWAYPNTPGQEFTTWVDGAEAWLAIEQGWPLEVHEGFTWAEGKPLEAWCKALVGVWQTANASTSPAARLGARAIRSILLFGIGAFASPAHPVTRTAPADSDPDVPEGAEVRLVGDELVWTEEGVLTGWALETAHPEWSAAIWARARTRLLLTPDSTAGALTLDPARVVGFHTDAIYLAGGEPEGWATFDDGKPGRFRVKGTIPGAFTWPASLPELIALSNSAE